MKKQLELKQSKNIKKKYIKLEMEKIEKVLSAGGFDAKHLGDEFDPLEYDKRTQALFGVKYYAEEDEDFTSDDEDGHQLPKDWQAREMAENDSGEEIKSFNIN
ncbi:unnamed protein product [Arabis nemorensis]|uniref:Uncharacterized protein n=1 Tax=Arabis nemorensis TaxID=586526 RepID=A0A565C5E2_9BRAS|nr:unnamed protein product [Arabis nemorensis]